MCRIAQLSTFGVLCVLLTAVAYADPLRDDVKKAVAKIVAVMEQRGDESITVLGVQDETTLQSPSMSGIRRMLEDELKKHVTLKESHGAIGVRARLLLHKHKIVFEDAPEGMEFADDRDLRIQFKLTDAFGEPIDAIDGAYVVPQDGERYVDDNTVLANDGRLKQKFQIEHAEFGQDASSPFTTLVAFGGNGNLIPPREGVPAARKS